MNGEKQQNVKFCNSLKWTPKESIAQPMKLTIGIVKSKVQCSWIPFGYKVKRYATMTKVTSYMPLIVDLSH